MQTVSRDRTDINAVRARLAGTGSPGMAELLMSGSRRSELLRQLLITALIAMPVLAGVECLGEHLKLFDRNWGIVVAVIVQVGVLGALIVRAALTLLRWEEESEHAQAAASDRLRTTLEAASSGTWYRDIKQDLFQADEPALAILGVSAGHDLRDWADFVKLVHSEDQERIHEASRRAASERVPFEANCRIVRKDGSIRRLAMRGKVYFDENRQPEYMTGLLMDITDRRDTEADRFQMALDSAQVSMWFRQPKKDMFYMDERSLSLFGLSTGYRFSGYQDYLKLIHPDDRAAAGEKGRRALAERIPYDDEYRILRQDGTVRHVAVKGKAHYDEHGQPEYMTGVFMDVTVRKETEEEIRHLNAVLSTAVSQILTAVSQSAAGAAESASALTKIGTTVEEVKMTSQLASQKAKYVSESSQRSEATAGGGRRATEETVESMQGVRQQMDLIAQSMVRLSEKSQSIVEIISVVDDLAQQSNLLAVNAAIESAKAGEQGKGFAVVAQEVKAMADQSKQATAQVRVILNDIQRATASAAMATELGTKAVITAAAHSVQAGDSIETLAASVSDVAQAASQILVASQEEYVGVDQVAAAMVGIKDAAEQNLVAIRQVEEAARSLSALSEKLITLTTRR
jgi:PAS domain S-box-containing protein